MRPQLSPHSALRALAGMSCVLGVVALLSGGCGSTPDNFSVLVLIENVPLDGSQLTVKAMLDGKSASNQLDVTNSLTRFGVRIPRDRAGSLNLNMQVLDSASCVLAEGTVSRGLAAPEYQVTLNTRLTTLQPRRCPIAMVPTCSPKLFCWSSPVPQGNPIRGVWAVSASDVWAVGDFGALMHYNGTTWQAVDSPVNDHLYAIWAGSAQDIFAVGDGGRILRSTGGTFQSTNSPTTQPLRGIWGNSATDEVWAVGNGGVILKYDRAGGSWSSVTSPTTNQLNAIWGSAKNRVYVAANGGTVLRYDGTSWGLEMNTGVSADLLGVGGDASKVVAVGVGGTLITSTAANSWTSPGSGTTNTLQAAWAKSGTYWAAGAGGVRLRDSGGGFAMVTGDGEAGGFYALGGSDAADVWAGGDGGLLTNYKTSWVGKPANPRQRIRAIYGFNNKNVWAIGTGGLILHYDGTSWTQVPSGTSQDLNGIWGASASDLWAVGNARTILRYDGKVWSSKNLGNAVLTDLNAVWGASASSVWVVGASSKPMENHLVNFVSATESAIILSSSTGSLPTFTSLWGASGDSFWVGGGNIAVNVLPVGPQIAVKNLSGSVLSLWGTRDNDIWATGTMGYISHYNGVMWSPVGSTVNEDLASVFGFSDSDVWAVGTKGTVVRWNGTAWSGQTSLTRNSLTGVWGSNSSDVWVSGELGTLLHTLK